MFSLFHERSLLPGMLLYLRLASHTSSRHNAVCVWEVKADGEFLVLEVTGCRSNRGSNKGEGL